MDAHNADLSIISRHVRAFHAQKIPFRIFHGSTNNTRQVDRTNSVDVSSLNRVLRVDRDSMTALVEPNVSMEVLVRETMKYELLAPVVMEFSAITCGGAFAGIGGESSSFRHGYFDQTLNWVEMVLADGDIVTASPTENDDLFFGAAGTMGTLGIVTLLELQLVPAQTWIELTYHPVRSMDEAITKFRDLGAQPEDKVQYLDGILFSPSFGVVISGCRTCTNPADLPVQRFSRARDEWFYLHAREVSSKSPEPYKELSPVDDYLFRYDRGAFWTGKYAFAYFVTPFTRLTRFLLDPFLRTKVMYRALHASGHMDRYILQDVAVPYSCVSEFTNWLKDHFNEYPLWLCPLKQTPGQNLSPMRAAKVDMLLNFGVWGPGPTHRGAFVDWNRKLEAEVERLGGRKWLYAQTFYTEEEFWKIYDKAWYDQMRRKWNAEGLPGVYEKVRPPSTEASPGGVQWAVAVLWSIWPLSGLWGVLMAILYSSRFKRLRSTVLGKR